MAKTLGYIGAELLIKIQGSDEPVSIGNIAIPLKIVSNSSFSLAVDHEQVRRFVEQVYQNPCQEPIPDPEPAAWAAPGGDVR